MACLYTIAVERSGPQPTTVRSRFGTRQTTFAEHARIAGAGHWPPVYPHAHAPALIERPSIVEAGNKPKIIREFVGRVNSATSALSIAQMQSPAGWVEPGQTPEFDEYTLVLRGTVRVTHRDGALDVGPGQIVLARAGEWVQYSTPGRDSADYVSVRLPAFSPDLVHRDP